MIWAIMQISISRTLATAAPDSRLDVVDFQAAGGRNRGAQFPHLVALGQRPDIARSAADQRPSGNPVGRPFSAIFIACQTRDSTGLKIHDACEWLEEKHKNKRKRRSWRKLHLGLDLVSGEIVCSDLTTDDVGDSTTQERDAELGRRPESDNPRSLNFRN